MSEVNASNAPARFCFKALLAVGLVLLLFGLFVVPVSPQFQLDAVLSKAEFADQRKRQATLELLVPKSMPRRNPMRSGPLAPGVPYAFGRDS